MNSLENLYYIPTLTDLWLSQALAPDIQTPLQNTFYDPFSPLSDILRPDQSTTSSSTLTSPSVSGSDLDTHIKRRITVVCDKKITKRKSRAVNKNRTTFINATAANFRHLVQQMTGVKSGVATLDATPFSFDRCQEFVPRAATSAMRQQGYFPAEGGVGFKNEGFPTLESWGLEIE